MKSFISRRIEAPVTKREPFGKAWRRDKMQPGAKACFRGRVRPRDKVRPGAKVQPGDKTSLQDQVRLGAKARRRDITGPPGGALAKRG